MLPNEVIEIIVKFLEACPDLMVARQINRQFRCICLHHRHERRLLNIANGMFRIPSQVSFEQLLHYYPGSLRLRFMKTVSKSDRYYWFPIRTAATQFNQPFLWNKFQPQTTYGNSVWGFLTNSGSENEKQHCAQGQLAIVKVRDSQAAECVFAMDVSVPETWLCQDMYSAWEEYNENSRIPFNHIIFASSSLPCRDPTFGYVSWKDDDLIRMVDTAHKTRLDIYIKWTYLPWTRYRYYVSARSYSKYGTLIIGFHIHPTQFLVIGKPQYIEERTQLDMSRQLAYFDYIARNNLFTVVTCPDDNMISPTIFPLAKENWFACAGFIFHIPFQCKDAPTYQEFLKSVPFESRPLHCSHLRASLAMDKQSLQVTPDFKLRYNALSTKSFCDNNFFIGGKSDRHNYLEIVDVRPEALDWSFRKKKFRMLKFLLPSSDIAVYTHYDKSYVYFSKALKPGLDCYKIELPAFPS